MRNDQLENYLDVRGGTKRQRYSDERVLPDGLALKIMCDGDYFVMYPLLNF